MNNKDLDERLPVLKEIDESRRKQFYTYFQSAPMWILDSFSVEHVEKGRIFIREDSPVDAIYFIVDGLIKATDYRIYGIKFDFILFTDVYAYGGMEVVMELNKYKTSLQTVTDCILLKIPKTQFAKWMRTDIQALRHETKLMAGYLLEQARSGRAFLFLQGANRLILLFISRYKKFAVDGVLKIDNNRQELSDYTGLSVKTITRSIKKLAEDEMLSKKGNQILIHEEQYEKMRQILSQILSEDDY